MSVMFRVIFGSRSLEFFFLSREESRICRFFFPFGLQKSTFSEIMGTTYRTELADY